MDMSNIFKIVKLLTKTLDSDSASDVYSKYEIALAMEWRNDHGNDYLRENRY